MIKNLILTTPPLTIKKYSICLLLFLVVSSSSLLAMKYILWAMFLWGGGGAIGLALVFTGIYVGGFFAVTKKWIGYKQHVSLKGLKWIWLLGFLQLAVLGILYHLLPQFFPPAIAKFFFA